VCITFIPWWSWRIENEATHFKSGPVSAAYLKNNTKLGWLAQGDGILLTLPEFVSNSVHCTCSAGFAGNGLALGVLMSCKGQIFHQWGKKITGKL
jgi:hypothetical protein